MAPNDWIAQKRFDQIRAETEHAMQMVREIPEIGTGVHR
jgi:hypothetical protein